jgi:glycosyltransferase involved in cell wall biosynthesis
VPWKTPTVRVAVPLEQCWHAVPGGTARVSIDLVAALVERSDVEVRGVSAWHRSPPDDPWRPPVDVARLPLPRLVLYEAWHGLRRPAAEWATGPVDVVHVVGGAVTGHRAPLVVTVHDLAFRHHPEMFTRHGIRFFERALALTAREAARVLVPSQATLEDCVSAGIDRDRLRHVPWGVTSRPVAADDVAAVRRRFGLEREYVVVVGTREPRKNLARLLAAWRQLDRDADLVVVGPEGWGDVTDGSDTSGSGSPPNVSMVGFVDDRTRDALYTGATASAYPSLFEGFGLPVLESMALGCPVVTSAGTATEELVVDGAGVAVDPTDVDAIAAGLASVLDDPALRQTLRERGSRRAAEFTWRAAAAQTVAAYEEAIG